MFRVLLVPRKSQLYFTYALYSDVMDTLRSLRYPLHSLFDYVLPEHHDEPRLAGVRRAGASVRGLFRVLLLKRLESSIEAFRKSLLRLRDRLTAALQSLSRAVVVVSRAPTSQDSEGLTSSDEFEVSANLFDVGPLQAAITMPSPRTGMPS